MFDNAGGKPRGKGREWVQWPLLHAWDQTEDGGGGDDDDDAGDDGDDDSDNGMETKSQMICWDFVRFITNIVMYLFNL